LAVTPASDDDVAQFLDELFSERRLERDERLRAALDSRPEPARKNPSPHNEQRAGQRSNSHGVPPAAGVLTRSRSLRLGVIGAAVVALAVVASGSFTRKGETETLTPPQAKIAQPMGATLRAPRAPEPVTPESPSELAVRHEPEPSDSDSLDSEPPRGERRAIDISPVREVGF
jgi:hypothetical protein